MQNHEKQYRIIVRENGVLIDDQQLDDPFITTSLRPKGWRAAWDALRGRMILNVSVRGTDAAHRIVFTGDYSPGIGGAAVSVGIESDGHGSLDLSCPICNCSLDDAALLDRGIECPSCNANVFITGNWDSPASIGPVSGE